MIFLMVNSGQKPWLIPLGRDDLLVMAISLITVFSIKHIDEHNGLGVKMTGLLYLMDM